MSDPLDILFVNEDKTVSAELLANTLNKFAQLTTGGQIHFLPAYHQLGTTTKILVALLAKKALSMKIQGYLEEATPKEIQTLTGLSVGSTNPTLCNLAKKRLVLAKKGRYFVPSFAMAQINSLIEKELMR